MLMNDFKKVRGYNPILFLRTAIESSKPTARGATRVAAVPECRNFLSHFMGSLHGGKTAKGGRLWQHVAISLACGTSEAIGGKRWRIAARAPLPTTTFRQQTQVVEHKG